MRSSEFLTESNGTLDKALADGWVRIRYTRLDGVSRIFMATTNPNFYTYNFKRSKQRWLPPYLLLVWEHKVGWRALRRNRIGGWKPA